MDTDGGYRSPYATQDDLDFMRPVPVAHDNLFECAEIDATVDQAFGHPALFAVGVVGCVVPHTRA